MRRLALLTATCLVLAGFTGASATTFDLFEMQINRDGTLTDLTGALSDFGVVSTTESGPGAHFLALFIDWEVDEPINTFFNEYGAAHGSLAAGQSWEIDEPGYVFGDIFTNFQNGALDNSNAVPQGLEDDVSMALGWSFTLLAGQTASVSWNLSQTQPTSGFYLSHTDPDSQATAYFSSTLNIGPNGGVIIPEPGTMLLLGTGLLGLAGWRRRAARS